MRPTKVFLATLGCPKNRVDSEKALWTLQKAGAVVTLEEQDADVLLVNTCGFITGAKEESIGRILELAEVKKLRAGVRLAVMGCLSERYREELSRQIPEIDHIYGVHELGKLAGELSGAKTPQAPMDPEAVTGRTLTTPVGWAYLKVAEGCSNSCSFCAIPAIRGMYRSRPAPAILEEARSLAAKGVKELNLVAQDTTLYGADIREKDGLAGLVRELAEVDGVEWIRIMYMYPPLLNRRLLETMSSTPKVVPYFDVPLQHASDRILSLMGRKETGDSIRAMVRDIRLAVPGAAIRSAFIVGFPGETDDDFELLLDFIKEARLDHVGAFIYSPEENTPAASMKGRPPARVAAQRLARLMEAQREISKANLAGQVGKTVDALVEGLDPEENLLVGRTARQAPEVDGSVILDGVEAGAGEMVRVRITGAMEYDLIAAPVD